jgi:hypothetical protein
MHDEFDEKPSGLVPLHRQLPSQPLTSVNPLPHGAPSPVIPQHALSPALPHAVVAASQWPLELMANGFADPPHVQSPEQPFTS